MPAAEVLTRLSHAHSCPVYELQRAHTPLRRSQFVSELASHPDKAFVSWLLHSIDNGVSLGYAGPRTSQISPNLSSARVHPVVIDQELAKECAAGRILGPFTTPPFPNLRCSGLGVVPKKNGKWRVIMHLSAPPGNSINDFIDPQQFPMHYSSVDDAVRLILRTGQGALMAKVDLKAAFRMVPVQRTDWNLLGIHWREQFYIDTCLPFGCRSSPYLFNQFAEALRWMLTENYHIHAIHYLDDYFMVGPPDSPVCSQAKDKTLQLCQSLGMPVATDKVKGPSTTLTFLGIEIDSQQQELRLPTAKLQELLVELNRWQDRRKATKRQLLSLIGKLAFAAKVVPAGRLFTRRLITLSTSKKCLHHHIDLSSRARADIRWWQQFLPSWNGRSIFLEEAWTDAEDLKLYTDASGSKGFGAYFDGEWIRGDWLPSQQLPLRSIQWQELFAIVAATMTWRSRLRGKKIRFNCDNEAIVRAWQKKSAKHPHLVALFRHLFLVAASANFTIFLQHIPGKENSIADALSRNQINRFFSLVPQANPNPTPLPDGLSLL